MDCCKLAQVYVRERRENTCAQAIQSIFLLISLILFIPYVLVAIWFVGHLAINEIANMLPKKLNDKDVEFRYFSEFCDRDPVAYALCHKFWYVWLLLWLSVFLALLVLDFGLFQTCYSRRKSRKY